MTTETEIRWEPPGPGAWEAETAHFPRPMPRFGRSAVAVAFKAAFMAGTARYGLLLSHFEIEFVNDFWFQQPAPFGAPKGAKGPPPKPILWLLTRLHPGMRARIRTSGEAFAQRRWREDLRTWDDTDKPAATAKHRELVAIDPTSLDDAALLAHLERCEKHVAAMIGLHHKYTMTCILPTGDFLAHVAEWTGKSPGEILCSMRGSTPLSNGISAGELEALVPTLKDDAEARKILESNGDPAEKLEALRAAPGATGEAARTFLDLVWHRAVSYSIGDKATGEMPEVLVGAIRGALAGTFKPRPEDAKAKTAALRALVPEAHRTRFDELLEEARVINRLRDERGLYADCWAIGIARRALLELGRRLVENGKLKAADEAVDLELPEARALLTGKGGPSLEEVHRRAVWRETKTVADIPAFLGGQPGGPPDPNILPPAAKRATRAVDAVLTNLFKEALTTSSKKIVRGLSVNDGIYEGTARLIQNASEFGRLQQGDVLVTRSTAPYFNVVLPLLGAIVTDRGGQLCHAAIVAREYGIPGVVGTKEATALIPDGARVRVDGTSGEVHVLGGA